MSEEKLPPIPQQAEEQKPMSITLGVFAIITSLFCWPVGLVLSIIGLCKYPKGSAGRVLSWISIGFFVLLIAIGITLGATLNKTAEEARLKIQQNHPELNEQQLLEYMQDPANKGEIQQYAKESVLRIFSK